jgi:hypothetical protein
LVDALVGELVQQQQQQQQQPEEASAGPQQQQQQPLCKLPVQVLEAAVQRAAAAAANLQHGRAEQQQQDVSSADALPAAEYRWHGCIWSSEQIGHSVAVLQQQLALLRFSAIPNNQAAADGQSSSSSRGIAGDRQPDGFKLASLLSIVPATVPVAVAGTTAAAALAAVCEAAAAARVPASSIYLCSVLSSSAQCITTPSNTAAAVGECRIKWVVLLLEKRSEAAVAAAARWLALHTQRHAGHIAPKFPSSASSPGGRTSREGTCSSSSEGSTSSDADFAPRVWIALPGVLAPALLEATGNTCLLWRLGSRSFASGSSSMLSLKADRALLSNSAVTSAAAAAAVQARAAFVMGALLQLQARGLLHWPGPAGSILQPLLVAALAALHKLHHHLQHQLQRGFGSAAGDLHGPADLLHLQLVLRQVAAATAAAAGLSSSSASSKPLKHLTRLPLDLQQLQQLLQWAVFGPSCSSKLAWMASQQSLQDDVTAAKLGVRELRVGGDSCEYSEVQVLGGCVADAVEAAARQLVAMQRVGQQQQMLLGLCRGSDSDGALDDWPAAAAGVASCSLRSNCEDESDGELDAAVGSTPPPAAAATAATASPPVDDDSGVVVPLGLSLSIDEVWGLLVGRMTE